MDGKMIGPVSFPKIHKYESFPHPRAIPGFGVRADGSAGELWSNLLCLALIGYWMTVDTLLYRALSIQDES